MLKQLFLYIRNKIRVAKNNELIIAQSKIVGCFFSVKGINNKLIIGSNCKIRESTFEINGKNCCIEIKDNVIIGGGCYFVVKGDNISISIGENSMLSRNIKIMAADGHDIKDTAKMILNPPLSILVGNHVWIADNVTVLKGVHIGHDCVLGINSTITKKIPSKSVAVGNPAKIVQENISWNE